MLLDQTSRGQADSIQVSARTQEHNANPRVKEILQQIKESTFLGFLSNPSFREIIPVYLQLLNNQLTAPPAQAMTSVYHERVPETETSANDGEQDRVYVSFKS